MKSAPRGPAPHGGHSRRTMLGKILVVGPGEAGKSTLIRALAANAANLEVRGRTVAMDHGIIQRGHASLTLVGVPGQGRFGPVREVLARGARGAVWVHPAGEPADPETVRLLAGPELAGVPYLVYVNMRPDAEADGRFSVPAGLPPPRALLRGSLVAPGSTLGDLERETWKLVEDAESQLSWR